MKRTKYKPARWLRRNCIRIPCAALMIAALVLANRYEYQQPRQMAQIDVVYAQEELPLNLGKVAETRREEPEITCIGSVEEMIEVACDYYGVPSEIALAIAKLETGHFTSAAYTELNNVGGLSVDEVPLAYISLMDGVDAFVANLANNYFNKGLDTPEKIGAKYCPSNDEWAETVTALMKAY